MRQYVVAALALAGAASANAQLLGVGRFANFATQVLYSIDPATGAATAIGDTGLTQIADIAWEQSTQRLLALTVAADLYAINPITGQSFLLAARAGTLPEGSLAIEPTTGRLLTTDADVLSVLNPSTAAVTAVGPWNLVDNDLSGLAFTLGGTLLGYAKNGSLPDSIVSINPATGAGTPIGLTGFDSAGATGGLATDTSGTVFLTSGGALYTVSPGTGAATLVGSHGVTGMSGIAVIPAPGAGLVLAIGGALAARRRRA